MVFFRRRTKRKFTLPGRLTGEQLRLYGCIAGLALLVFLAVFGLCGRSGARSDLSKTRALMAEAIQNDMNRVLSSYESMSRKSTTAIVEEVLPEMEKHMYSAKALNQVLIDSFGEQYSVLDDSLYAGFQDVAARYADTVAKGQSTTAAAQELTDFMVRVETALRDRFGSEGSGLRTALR